MFTDNTTGKYYNEGDIIKRPEYAKTLQKIGQSNSSDIFYKGEMGQILIEELSQRGGMITEEDLKLYKYECIWLLLKRMNLNFENL